MTDRRGRSEPDPIPRSYVRYTLATCLVAVPLAIALGSGADWRTIEVEASFWMYAAFVVVGELLPIEVPRRDSHDKVSISTAFAFAVLLSFGAGPAIVVYVAGSVIADLKTRNSPTKGVFNAAQYVLSVAAAAGALSLAGHPAPVPLVGDSVVSILLAALVWFAVNHVLAGVGAALLTGCAVRGYLRHDLAFQAWTAGFLLTLAPIVVVSARESLVLIPVAFLPMLAIYFGGREAALNAHRALHDDLTDLPNRRLLRQRMDDGIASARRDQLSMVVLMIDLDDFKDVNDSLGHRYGDLLLTQVGHRLQASLRENDTLARLGGDEFAVLVEGLPRPDRAPRFAARILAALEAPFEVNALSLDVRASIGIACYPQHGNDADELLQRADMALYRAKESESPYEVFTDEQDKDGLDRLVLAAQLRRGIERGELVLHYQPKVRLQGTGPLGVEALVRWNHPQFGLIGPDGFIPLAEHTGLIAPLTAHVLDAALSQCAEWRRSGLEVRMSVNICTRSLLDLELGKTIGSLLGRYDLPPNFLQLEVTESRIVTDLRRARNVLEALREMGIAIAIDDFGTGFSSLTQLQQLPVDEIKIDKSFVGNWETSAHDRAIVRSTIDLGRNLGLHVTAEGVESEGVCRQLVDLGCDFAQGFYFARPSGADECAREVARHNREADPYPHGGEVLRLDGGVSSMPAPPETQAARLSA